MNIHEVNQKVIERGFHSVFDWAHPYDISQDEALRIAKKSERLADFERVMIGEYWWRDPERYPRQR